MIKAHVGVPAGGHELGKDLQGVLNYHILSPTGCPPGTQGSGITAPLTDDETEDI